MDFDERHMDELAIRPSIFKFYACLCIRPGETLILMATRERERERERRCGNMETREEETKSPLHAEWLLFLAPCQLPNLPYYFFGGHNKSLAHAHAHVLSGT